MQRQAKAQRILSLLEELYPAPPIPLDHRDPFTLLVAVLLSAQTTDKKVNEVTPALFDAAPTPEALAALEEAEILAFIRQLGLAPQKARALKGLATKLVAEHRSQVPQSFEALEALPGVGHKTASVVMAQAFGHPAFPVDTHIHRLAWRWGLSDGRSVDQTERDLKELFAEEHWNKLHLQIIYFGREHCPAQRHVLETCPICAWAAPPAVRRAEERGRELGGPTAVKLAPRATKAKGTKSDATKAKPAKSDATKAKAAKSDATSKAKAAKSDATSKAKAAAAPKSDKAAKAATLTRTARTSALAVEPAPPARKGRAKAKEAEASSR